MRVKRALLAGAAALTLATGAAAYTAAPSHAATPVQINLPLDTSASNPNGLALDALNWGGTGGGASACTAAVINAEIGVYSAAHAGCAADFVVIPITGGAGAFTATAAPNAGPYELVYAPDGNILVNASAGAPQGYCVSTVTDVQGAIARLRGCSATLVSSISATVTTATQNQWQDFWQVSGMTDISGAVILQAEGALSVPASITGFHGYALNDKAYGGNLSPVISWPPTNGENQVWLVG